MTSKTNSPSSSTDGIPEHLQEYITEQEPELYSPEDHAAWRFIMRVSKSFFSKHAHPLYLAGLEATGISTDRIPLISEMDAALRKMGWRAVAINGFIPPSIFLEFQSLKILAIACDMRKIENLGYTPSPDIVHEAAGHAPIVCDPHYRKYLEAYGQVARNAIISRQDIELYDAIFDLSEIKENPKATKEEITRAQKKFEEVAAKITHSSEAAVLARMAWWTTEYGMIEVDGKPLIYGAGLLSSIHESHHCIFPTVKKIPFNLHEALTTSYDITRPQPQLFVAKDFDSLTEALEKFAAGMAFRRGGAYGLGVAKKAAATVTLVYESGIQISGTVSDYQANESGDILSVTLIGQKQISKNDQVIANAKVPGPAQDLILPHRDYPQANGKIISVFGGAADRTEFALRHSDQQKKVAKHKTNLTPENQDLNSLYAKIRLLRESGKADEAALKEICKRTPASDSRSWLVLLEELELYQKWGTQYAAAAADLKQKLLRLAQENKNIREQIEMGLGLLE